MRYRLAARQELDAQLRRLREERLLVIEVTTPADLLREPDVDPIEMPTGTPRAGVDAESAFRRVALDRSVVAWRDGMAQRAMGLQQLPAGLMISAISWVAAYVLGYLATQVDGAGVGLLAVSAMVAITIAWVVSWMVVEATMLDWRFDARRAAAYDLLSRARLEFTTES